MNDLARYRAFVDKHATITLTVEQDDLPVRGNALASGDDATDKRVEDAILRRLDRGDVWAWASVRVCASYDGLHGNDYLGACSYKDEKEFCRPGGYYADMVYNAKLHLAEALMERKAQCDALEGMVPP